MHIIRAFTQIFPSVLTDATTDAAIKKNQATVYIKIVQQSAVAIRNGALRRRRMQECV